jgi:hypothetical protein
MALDGPVALKMSVIAKQELPEGRVIAGML